MKHTNSLWNLEEEYGTRVMGFGNVARAGVNNFNNLFKEDEGASIYLLVRSCTTHPLFVNEEQNNELMEEVSLEELKEAINSMQKGKSHGLDGWPVEFFIFFMELSERDLLDVVE